MTSSILSNTVNVMWMAPETGLVARIHQAAQQRGVNYAQVLVLLPYAQLMPVAQKFWAQAYPTGLAPRFETTQNWAASLAAFLPDATDISFDKGRDLLRAQDLLVQAGLHRDTSVLSPRLVDAAHQLGRRVAAIAPSERAAWATLMRPVVANGLDTSLLALESAVACIALEWALASDYKTDVLFAHCAEFFQANQARCLVVVHGIQQDSLMQALAECAGLACVQVNLPMQAAYGGIQLYATASAEDEAQSAAACVLRHLEQGRLPVALVVSERSLTRRISSILATQKVVLRDENGWKLSTTRSAAQLMAALRACHVYVAADDVLNWLKNAPAFEPEEVSFLEKEMRKVGIKKWSKWLEFIKTNSEKNQRLLKFSLQIQLEVQKMAGQKTLQQWQIALQRLLVFCGQWTFLAQDAAGQKITQVLRLDSLTQAEFANQMAGSAAYLAPIGLAEFISWLDSVLETEVFKLNETHQAHVVVLPLSQLLARPFSAVVLAGCDAERLNVAPEPTGLWTLSQRKALALATRDELQNANFVAWQQALQIPHCDILWRTSTDSGEVILPCAWVQMLQLEQAATSNPESVQMAADPRDYQLLHEQLTPPPAPQASALPVHRLSASAYEDLRACPYRFFALRQLGLKDSPELDSDLDKRDFGLWLHAVLKNFHMDVSQELQPHNTAMGEFYLAAMQRAVAATNLAMNLSEAEFLPFAAAWPKIREGYLTWLEADANKKYQLVAVERWLEQPLGQLTLVGQIDRIDMLAPAALDGAAADLATANLSNHSEAILRVIDYKTESPDKTNARIRNLTEDTQLAFYATLVASDSPQAAYVNVDEKSGTKLYEMTAIVEVREALAHGIIHDMQQIAAGAKLPALGTEPACHYCAARGLCRKDFWQETEGAVCTS